MNFKLIDSSFFENERIWNYSLDSNILFNHRKINRVTITDHYRKKQGRENVNNELIIDLIINKLNFETLEKVEYSGEREVFRWEPWYLENNYRLIFWFKDGTNNHLWIRNCHRID